MCIFCICSLWYNKIDFCARILLFIAGFLLFQIRAQSHGGIGFGIKREIFFLNLEDGYFGCQVNESTDVLQLYELSKLCDGTSQCYKGSDELRRELKCTSKYQIIFCFKTMFMYILKYFYLPWKVGMSIPNLTYFYYSRPQYLNNCLVSSSSEKKQYFLLTFSTRKSQLGNLHTTKWTSRQTQYILMQSHANLALTPI